jgi:hypothetical protein
VTLPASCEELLLGGGNWTPPCTTTLGDVAKNKVLRLFYI